MGQILSIFICEIYFIMFYILLLFCLLFGAILPVGLMTKEAISTLNDSAVLCNILIFPVTIQSGLNVEFPRSQLKIISQRSACCSLIYFLLSNQYLLSIVIWVVYSDRILFKFHIIRIMAENILDQTHPQNNEFANCKIKYLITQNKLMSVQLCSISNLVDKYKKIIDILSKTDKKQGHNLQATQHIQQKERSAAINQGQSSPDQAKGTKQIFKILKDAEKVIENCVTECRQISNSKSIFEQDQGIITPGFFSELVLSYEKTIAQLKQSIHQRQILLQQLQVNPNHQMRRICDQTQSTAIVKAIQSYDIYPKISQKCRKQILELKQRKKQFQLENSSKLSNVKSNKLKSNHLNEIDKTVKKVAQYNNHIQEKLDQKTQAKTDLMSPFQKTILIYKKKKIFNDILEAKVIDLKKKIKEKEHCNQVLRRRLENQVWNNIQNINHFGKNLDEDDPAYLSILNQSLKANNLDFSIDISRVMATVGQKNEIITNTQNILQQVNKQITKDNQLK